MEWFDNDSTYSSFSGFQNTQVVRHTDEVSVRDTVNRSRRPTPEYSREGPPPRHSTPRPSREMSQSRHYTPPSHGGPSSKRPRSNQWEGSGRSPSPHGPPKKSRPSQPHTPPSGPPSSNSSFSSRSSESSPDTSFSSVHSYQGTQNAHSSRRPSHRSRQSEPSSRPGHYYPRAAGHPREGTEKRGYMKQIGTFTAKPGDVTRESEVRIFLEDIELLQPHLRVWAFERKISTEVRMSVMSGLRNPTWKRVKRRFLDQYGGPISYSDARKEWDTNWNYHTQDVREFSNKLRTVHPVVKGLGDCLMDCEEAIKVRIIQSVPTEAKEKLIYYQNCPLREFESFAQTAVTGLIAPRPRGILLAQADLPPPNEPQPDLRADFAKAIRQLNSKIDKVVNMAQSPQKAAPPPPPQAPQTPEKRPRVCIYCRDPNHYFAACPNITPERKRILRTSYNEGIRKCFRCLSAQCLKENRKDCVKVPVGRNN